MRKEIKNIDIVLENCEVITIPKQHIGLFTIDKIKRKISRVACNAIDDYLVAKEFSVQIHKDADIENNICENFRDYSKSPFKRLTDYNDITHIYVIYEDDTIEEFCIKWYGDSDCYNEHQYSKLGEDGHLYILCKKNGNIQKYFNGYINNDNSWRWL